MKDCLVFNDCQLGTSSAALGGGVADSSSRQCTGRLSQVLVSHWLDSNRVGITPEFELTEYRSTELGVLCDLGREVGVKMALAIPCLNLTILSMFMMCWWYVLTLVLSSSWYRTHISAISRNVCNKNRSNFWYAYRQEIKYKQAWFIWIVNTFCKGLVWGQRKPHSTISVMSGFFPLFRVSLLQPVKVSTFLQLAS